MFVCLSVVIVIRKVIKAIGTTPEEICHPFR